MCSLTKIVLALGFFGKLRASTLGEDGAAQSKEAQVKSTAIQPDKLVPALDACSFPLQEGFESVTWKTRPKSSSMDVVSSLALSIAPPTLPRPAGIGKTNTKGKQNHKLSKPSQGVLNAFFLS